MSESVPAEIFLKQWLDVCMGRHDDLYKDWFNARGAYTRHALDGPDPVIATVAKRMGLQCFNDPRGYYHTDAILFYERDLVPGIKAGTTWVRRIRVAFEHENNFKQELFKETGHLMIIDCDLRVLVTYPPSKAALEVELRYLHTVISGSDRAAQFSDARSILFIFGDRNTEKASIGWEAYVYNQANWLSIGVS